MTAFLLIVILCIILFYKGYPMCFFDEDEEIVTTTTTTTEKGYTIVGDLKRQEENGQFFVIDPVDSQKIFVNSHDDMYEDAADKVWKLI